MLLLDTAAVLEAAAENADIVAVVDDISNGLSSAYHVPKIAVSIAAAAVILIAAKVIASVIKHSLRKLAGRSRKFSLIMAQLVWKLCTVVIWIFAIVAVLGIFGIDLTPILAGLGITGVVLGFALQESISSFFSGIMIAVNNPFRVGDWVDIGDMSGTVEAMDLMCVTLSSGDNKKITMNNRNVWGSTIVNYSHIEKRRLDMKVTVRYTDDLAMVKGAIQDLLSTYPEVLRDPLPLVEVGEYGSSAVTIYARPWVLPGDYWNVYWRFNGDILGTLHESGADMPFSQVVVHMADKG